jgi:hypothetical protein
VAKTYRVTLTAEERAELEAMIGKGTAGARRLAHARVLLQADEADGAPARTDQEVASALDLSARTVERVRRRFVEETPQALPNNRRVTDKERNERQIEPGAQMDEGGHPEGGGRSVLAGPAEPRLQLGGARALDPRAVAAHRLEAVDQQLLGIGMADLPANTGGQGPQWSPAELRRRLNGRSDRRWGARGVRWALTSGVCQPAVERSRIHLLQRPAPRRSGPDGRRIHPW